MKKFWLCIVLAFALGTSVAWAINYSQYGQRVGRFGPFSTNRDFLPTDVKLQSDKLDARPGAKVELVGQPTFDFGMMAPGTEGEHVFVVKSIGKEDLRLRLGATTCKCTLGDLEREALAPGEETEVKLSWTVKAGEVEFKQSAQLITNDPSQVVIQLEITGQVIKDVDIVPETWTFGEVATGEPMEVEGTIYSFLEHDIKPTEVRFTSDAMNDLAEFDVESFKPTKEGDGIRSVARQGFRIKANIKAGMRQGSVSQNLVFGFQRIDENGETIIVDEGDKDPNDYVYAPVKGRIVGTLGMIVSSKLKGRAGAGYVYDFGRIGRNDPLKAKTFVVLKGSERDNTNLRVGELVPDGVVKATLGEPKGRGSMKLYPLEIELVPGDELIQRLGNDNDDYGSVWIESDNPKVTKMRIGLKFAIEPR